MTWYHEFDYGVCCWIAPVMRGSLFLLLLLLQLSVKAEMSYYQCDMDAAYRLTKAYAQMPFYGIVSLVTVSLVACLWSQRGGSRPLPPQQHDRAHQLIGGPQQGVRAVSTGTSACGCVLSWFCCCRDGLLDPQSVACVYFVFRHSSWT